MATPLDIIKSNLGSLAGLAGSKKYALTVTFMAYSLFSYSETSSIPVRIALLSAATTSLVAYLVCQTMLEIKGALATISDTENVAPTTTAVAK